MLIIRIVVPVIVRTVCYGAARPINSIDFFIIRWVLGYFQRTFLVMVPIRVHLENYSSGGEQLSKESCAVSFRLWFFRIFATQ